MEKTVSPISFARQLQVFLPFALGYFLSYLYRVINAVPAPDLAADQGVDPSGLGLLTATYFITFAAFQRVNTALNLLVFLAAFSAQWSIGAIIGVWPTTQSGGYAPVGYQAAFGILLAIQLISIFWFWFAGAILKKASYQPVSER